MSQKVWLSMCLMAVRFAKYCGKMYSSHLLSAHKVNFLFYLYDVNFHIDLCRARVQSRRVHDGESYP